MTYSIQRLNHSTPVVLGRMTNPFDFEEDVERMLLDLDATLDEIQAGRIHLIIDLSSIEITLKGLVQTIATIRHMWADAAALQVFNRRVHVSVVEAGGLLQLVVNSFNETRPANPIRLFTSLGKAIAHTSQSVRIPAPAAGMAGAQLPGAILRTDLPAPVVHYALTADQVFNNSWEQVALDIVMQLAGIEGDAAYVVIETPRLDISIAEMTAILSSTNQPHGGSEIPRKLHGRPLTLTQGESGLHVVMSGLHEGRYGPQYRKMFRMLNHALDHVSQAWMVIRTVKGAFGLRLAGYDPLAHRGN